MRFRKKPIVVEATQWFKNGDHPLDACYLVKPLTPFEGDTFPSEGKIVRYFRYPGISGSTQCLHCTATMHMHGWIDTLEGGSTVCPGDWIITGIKNEFYPCKPDVFEATYEPVGE